MHLFIHSKTNNQEMTSFCCLYAILRHFHYKHDFSCMMEDLQGQPFNFANFIKLLDLYRIEYQYCEDYQEIFKRKGSVFLIHTTNGSVLYMGDLFNYIIYMDPLNGYCIKNKNAFLSMNILDVIDITFIGRYPFYHQSLKKLYEPFKPLLLKIIVLFLSLLAIYLILNPRLKLIFFYFGLLFSFYQVSKMFYHDLMLNIENMNKDLMAMYQLYREGVGVRITLFSLCFFEICGLVFYDLSLLPLYLMQQLFCLMESLFLYQETKVNYSKSDEQLQKVQILDYLKYLTKYPLKAYFKYSLILLHFLCLILYIKYPLYVIVHLAIMVLFGIYKSYLLYALRKIKSHEQMYYMQQYEKLKYMPLTKIESIKLYDHNQFQTIHYFYLYAGEALFLDASKLKINENMINKYAPKIMKETIAYYQSFDLPLYQSVLEYLNEKQVDMLFYLLPIFTVSMLHQKIGELHPSYQALIGFVKAYTTSCQIIFFDRCLTLENLASIEEFVNKRKDKTIIVAL